MKTEHFQLADVLPSRLTQGIFCEEDDQLFVALCEPDKNATQQVSTLHVYDLSVIDRASETVELGDKTWPKLPLHWFAQAEEVYQSVLYEAGQLILTGKDTVMQITAEAGPVTSQLDGGDALVWDETPLKFPDPIYPPLVHGSEIVVLSHTGDIYKFPRRHPPSAALEPIFSLDGASARTYKHALDQVPKQFPRLHSSTRMPGVLVENVPIGSKVGFHARPLPGALVGDRLMYRFEDRIIVYDVKTQTLISDKSMSSVSLLGESYDFLNGRMRPVIDPAQSIVSLNGYGFLPFHFDQDFLEEDDALREILRPHYRATRMGSRGGRMGFIDPAQLIRFHLVPGVIIAPDGALSLSLAGPYRNDPTSFEAVNLFGDATRKPSSKATKEGASGVIDAKVMCVDGRDIAVFNRTHCQANMYPWGMAGADYGLASDYFGESERTVVCISIESDGRVVFGDLAEHLPTEMSATKPFARSNQTNGSLEKVTLVASETNLNIKVEASCAVPGDVTSAKPKDGKDAPIQVINGNDGHSIAFCVHLNFASSNAQKSANNVLLFSPNI